MTTTTTPPVEGGVIRLGELGRGRALVEVYDEGATLLLRRRVVVEARGDGLGFRVYEKTEERRVPRPAALLRVNTAALGSYHEGRNGRVWALGGAFVVAEGLFASGAAGRCGDAPDVLVGFRAGEPGAVVALGYGHMRAVAWAWDGQTVRECVSLADVPEEARPILAAAVARLYRRGLVHVAGWAAVSRDGRRVPVTGHTPLVQEREWARAEHVFWGVVLRLEDGSLRFLEGDEALQDDAGVEVALGAGRHEWCGWVPGTRAVWTETGQDAPAGASWWEAELASTPVEAVETASGVVEVEVAAAPVDKRDRRMFASPIHLEVSVAGETVEVTLSPATNGPSSAYEWADAGVIATAPGWAVEVLEAATFLAASGYTGLQVRLRMRRVDPGPGHQQPANQPQSASTSEADLTIDDLPELEPPAPVDAATAASALAAAWGVRRR